MRRRYTRIYFAFTEEGKVHFVESENRAYIYFIGNLSVSAYIWVITVGMDLECILTGNRIGRGYIL